MRNVLLSAQYFCHVGSISLGGDFADDMRKSFFTAETLRRRERKGCFSAALRLRGENGPAIQDETTYGMKCQISWRIWPRRQSRLFSHLGYVAIRTSGGAKWRRDK